MGPSVAIDEDSAIDLKPCMTFARTLDANCPSGGRETRTGHSSDRRQRGPLHSELGSRPGRAHGRTGDAWVGTTIELGSTITC